MRTRLFIGLSVVIVSISGLLAVGLGSGARAVQMVTPPEHTFADLTPVALLRQPVPDANPDAARLRRGQYLVAAGDCMSCHLRPGGEAFSGGLGLNTPFGTIYSSNITPDRETGIGGWSEEQFYRAMHDGIGADGENLYPAFPYPWFRNLPREDTDAILAYLKSTPPVHYTPPNNELHFPMGFRFLVKGWNLLHLKEAEFQADSTRSPEWNRGAWLVKGPGHCSGCHTAKGSLGADERARAFFGGDLDSWVAPDLTPNTRTGLGAWGAQDIAEYLKSGRNAHAAAGGPMADVVTYSTSLLTDEDRKAISTYLQSLPASPALDRDRRDGACGLPHLDRATFPSMHRCSTTSRRGFPTFSPVPAFERAATPPPRTQEPRSASRPPADVTRGSLPHHASRRRSVR